MSRVCAAAQLEISPETAEVDYEVETKVGADGVARVIRKKVTGNTVKDLLRSVRKSIPVMKLIEADATVREYLMYTLLHFWASRGL